jgi:hypothetical protein
MHKKMYEFMSLLGCEPCTLFGHFCGHLQGGVFFPKICYEYKENHANVKLQNINF